MRLLIALGFIFVTILVFSVASVFFKDITRSRYRIVESYSKIDECTKYIIQYRNGLFWYTYYIPGTGEPAVYYVYSEAEGFVKELVDRGQKASFKKTRKTTVHEYNEKGDRIGKKK